MGEEGGASGTGGDREGNYKELDHKDSLLWVSEAKQGTESTFPFHFPKLFENLQGAAAHYARKGESSFGAKRRKRLSVSGPFGIPNKRAKLYFVFVGGDSVQSEQVRPSFTPKV